MPAFIVIPPEQIERARKLYEGTSVPVRDIATMLGIGITTFEKRVKLWGWTPRNRRLADLDAAAKAQIDLAAIQEIAAPAVAVAEHATLVERVRSAVEREIAAIDAVLVRVESATLRSPDAERAARTLATLVKTLRELNALETYGVNSGTGRSAKVLQRIVGTVPDGIIGKKTLAAVSQQDPQAIVLAMCEERLGFLHRLRTWPIFGRGWGPRVQHVEDRALAMIRQARRAA